MGQRAAVELWWGGADETTRRRALLLAEDDLLPEDMALDLAMYGATVVPLGASDVDGRPAGYVPPDVLVHFLAEVRAR